MFPPSFDRHSNTSTVGPITPPPFSYIHLGQRKTIPKCKGKWKSLTKTKAVVKNITTFSN